MKILNRMQFLECPSGTIFCDYTHPGKLGKPRILGSIHTEHEDPRYWTTFSKELIATEEYLFSDLKLWEKIDKAVMAGERNLTLETDLGFVGERESNWEIDNFETRRYAVLEMHELMLLIDTLKECLENVIKHKKP